VGGFGDLEFDAGLVEELGFVVGAIEVGLVDGVNDVGFIVGGFDVK